MKKFFKSHHGSLTELNITPLLDLVIVLLMIFIIAAPQLMNDLELSLPSSELPPQNQTNKPPELTYISVDASGAVTLNRRPCKLEALKAALQQLRQENPELSVVVSGNEEADYEMVVGILDVLQQVNITRIGLATEGG